MRERYSIAKFVGLVLLLSGACVGQDNHQRASESRVRIIGDVESDFVRRLEIHGRFALASSVVTDFGFPRGSIPPSEDSMVFVGYYIVPENVNTRYFELRLQPQEKNATITIQPITISGHQQRGVFCYPIEVATGYTSGEVSLDDLKPLLNQPPRMKLVSCVTK